MLRCITAAALLTVLVHADLASQPAVAADLLQRAATYATQFRHAVSGIATEETYVQDIGRLPGSSVDVVSGGGLAVVSHRELKSDLLLVRPGGTERPIDSATSTRWTASRSATARSVCRSCSSMRRLRRASS